MADTKLADLTALTTPSGDDILYIVDDPAGTPLDRKIAIDNLFTRGTITADAPVLNMSQTWNNAAVTFTGLKFNATDTASNAASLLMDLHVGSVSVFNVSKGGSLKLGLNTSGTNVAASNVIISGPQGTGTGAGGSIIFQVAPAGGSGAVQNALATAWSISGAGNLLAGTDNTYDIGASGATRPRNVFVVGTVTTGTVLASIVRSSNFNTENNTNTVLSFTNSSDNLLFATGGTSPRINFCGTTSSFPALKRVSANLQVIAADGTSSAGLIVGNQALATTATDGFLYVPTCAGTPTGTPTTQTGTAPIVINTTNNKLYFYSDSAWRDAGP